MNIESEAVNVVSQADAVESGVVIQSDSDPNQLPYFRAIKRKTLDLSTTPETSAEKSDSVGKEFLKNQITSLVYLRSQESRSETYYSCFVRLDITRLFKFWLILLVYQVLKPAKFFVHVFLKLLCSWNHSFIGRNQTSSGLTCRFNLNINTGTSKQ